MKPGLPERKGVIFHIGLERTGTTTLQNHFTRNADVLAAHSILYPTRNAGFEGNNHKRLVSSYLPPERDDFYLRPNADAKDPILASLKREIEGSDARLILISGEHFSSRFRLPQIQRLAADFAEFDCTIIVFVRDGVSRFFSAYATHIASFGHQTLETFADDILLPNNIYISCRETLTLWSQVFGVENMIVRAQSQQKALIEDFFRATGMPLPPGFEIRPSRDNKSLGPRRTELLRRANDLIAEKTRSASAGQHAIQGFVRSLLHLGDGFSRGPRWTLDADRLARLQAIAQADRAWLEERHDVRLDGKPRCDPRQGFAISRSPDQ